MMEYSSSDLNDTLIEKLFNLPGVVRVDTHTRTPTLGKWNIAVDQLHYLTLCEQIDNILTTAYEDFPDDVKQTGKYKDFPQPRRLTKFTPTVFSSTSSVTTK